MRQIDEFYLVRKEKRKQKEEKELPQVGSFEKLMKVFGGKK